MDIVNSKNTLAEEDWDLLVRRIRSKKCTPFIGAGASVPNLPLGSQLAHDWAARFRYPLVDAYDLAKVAQFLAVTSGDDLSPKEQVQIDLMDKPAPDYGEPDQPHRMLADLDLPIYLTTNYDDFMYDALASRGKQPRREVCHWNSYIARLAPSVLQGGYAPSPPEPLVFHLHGFIEQAETLVLTEDDYLEFLVNFSQENKLQFLPDIIRTKLATTSLLFVGYSLADWNFRVLFRSLLESFGDTPGLKSIAVQFEPPAIDKSEAGIQRAMDYLNKYFSTISNKIEVRVYWGDARTFARELRARMGI
jgi:hypothetical protein